MTITNALRPMLSAALFLLVPTVAQAQEDNAASTTVNFSLAAGTDYVWRGLTQTDGGPAAFATVTVQHGGFYAGAGTENVDFSGISQEYDLWGGYVVDLGPARLDLGASFYGYVDAPSNIDTLEFKAALSGGRKKIGYTVSANYTPDYFGTGKGGVYSEAAVSYALSERVQLSGALGHQQIEALPDYATWNLGASGELAKGLRLDLRYHDTDTKVVDYETIGDARVVATLTFTP